MRHLVSEGQICLSVFGVFSLVCSEQSVPVQVTAWRLVSEMTYYVSSGTVRRKTLLTLSLSLADARSTSATGVKHALKHHAKLGRFRQPLAQ